MRTLVTTTVSEDAGQTPFTIVHIKVFAPVASEVTDVEPEFAEVKFPVPEKTLHVPIPFTGLLPDKFAVEPHTEKFAPAFAFVLGKSTVMIIVSVAEGQIPLEVVQRKTF